MAEISFQIEAGALVRGKLRRAIKEYCYSRGYPVDIEEDKGFLESLMFFKITVPDSQCQIAYSEISNWAKEIQE